MIKTQPWHVNPPEFYTSTNNDQKPEVLIEGGPVDYEKVVGLYQKSPIAGYSIGKVEIINNPSLIHQFEEKVKSLNTRGKNPKFTPEWKKDGDFAIRYHESCVLNSITKRHPATYKDVQLFPAFHGTKASLLNTIFHTGFEHPATRDSGCAGKGIYNTQYAEYAHRVYSSDGTLIFTWVAFYSAYPVTRSDMPKIQKDTNYSNYDAHYALVSPKNSNNENEVAYLPIISHHKTHTYDELVVCDPSQVLPCYLITLAPDGLNLKPLAFSFTEETLMKAISTYLPDAPALLQPYLEELLVTFSSQKTTALSTNQFFLLTLIESSKGESDSTIKRILADRITKLLDVEPAVVTIVQNSSLTKAAITNPVRTLIGHKNSVHTLMLLADGSFASGSKNTIIVWDYKERTSLYSLKGNGLIQLVDGRLASYYKKSITLWDPKSGTCLHTLNGHTNSIKALRQLADGSLASGSKDKTIRIWDQNSATCLSVLTGSKKPVYTLFELSDIALASRSKDKTITLWDRKSATSVDTIKGEGRFFYNLRQLSDRTFACFDDQTIKVWDFSLKTCLHTVNACEDKDTRITRLEPLSNGTFATASLRFIKAPEKKMDEEEEKNDITLIIKIWDSRSGACQTTFKIRDSVVITLRGLSDGTLLTDIDEQPPPPVIKIWDTQTGTCLHTLRDREHKKMINDVILLPNGTLASCESGDETIKLWG